MKRTVVHYIDSTDVGGAEKMLLTILKGLDRDKWSPVIIYHREPGLKQFVENLNALELDSISLPRIGSWRDFSGFASFIKKLREIKPSIFHAHLVWNLKCSYGIIAAYLSRVPLLVATQYAYQQTKARRQIIFQKLISRMVDRYIAVSKGLADSLNKALYSNDKTVIIHNGINTKKFRIPPSDTLKNQLGVKSGTPIILAIARLEKIKGLEFLIRAAPEVPQAVFALAGEGAEKENFKGLAARYDIKDRIIFLGHRDDIPELLSSCDVFVLPSLNDALPLSILEAMAAQKPVVASNINGIDEEVIHNQTGLLVPKENPEALAEAINSLISDTEYAKKLGEAGRVRVEEHFSSDTMLKRITDLYVELLER